MRAVQACVLGAAYFGLATFAWGSTVSFTNHSQPNNNLYGGGVPVYQHADLNGDGIEDLVFGYHPEMGSQDTFAVQLATGNGAYAAPTGYTLPPNGSDQNDANSIVMGDFNNDGSIDILVFGALNAYFYANNGKGLFTLKSTTQFGDANHAFAQAVAGDFNHDNLTDVVFISSGLLYIWFGKGDGTFTPGPAMGVEGWNPQIADFDGDGKADILLTDVVFISSGLLYIWFGKGDGTFNPGPAMGVEGGNPQIGDFDGDGKADILLTDNVNFDIAYVLYGDGKGNFPATKIIDMSPSSATPPSSAYVTFTVGDVNSDGRSDVLAVQPGVHKNRVYVYYGNVARSFANTTSVAVSRCLSGAAQVADLDGNGYNDLIVQEANCSDTSTGTIFVSVLTRNANASYNAEQTIYTSQPQGGITYPLAYPPIVIRADLNTKPDLVETQCADSRCDGYNAVTQINTSSGGFPTCNAPAAAKGIHLCSPTTSVNSPVPFAVGAAGATPMRDVEVWVDGTKRTLQIDGFSNYTFLNKSLSLNPGSHNVTIYAAGWDQSLVKKSLTVQVK